MRTSNLLAVLAVLAGTVVLPGQAQAAAPQRFTETEHESGVVGRCGAGGDRLVIDFTRTSTVTLFASGRGTLHLQLVGTLTRTGSGVVAKYSELQRDFEFIDGTETSVGLLGHLVVPGGRGLTFAGRAVVNPDGTVTTTPGVTPLLDLDFVQAVCDALAN
ncbi:MAG: hypothetical protein QOK15_3396 [Nocardioidaceae bacterium]|nr:hypothetical protein [Nocardioidaceae bacterium]